MGFLADLPALRTCSLQRSSVLGLGFGFEDLGFRVPKGSLILARE